MIVLMHYAAVQVLEPHARREIRQAVAEGQHLSTLAFSESGSRSHFWAPLGTATQTDGGRGPPGGMQELGHFSWTRRQLRLEQPPTRGGCTHEPVADAISHRRARLAHRIRRPGAARKWIDPGGGQ